MSRPRLPAPVATLAGELAGLPGAVAVVLGGSRATATHSPGSDWDLGVYYRGSRRPIDPEDVRRLGHRGHVSELGEWGPIVNGGVLNEKRLVQRAGLDDVQPLLARPGATRAELAATVAAVSASLGVEPLATR